MGQVLTLEGVEIARDKKQAVTEMPTPCDIHNVHGELHNEVHTSPIFNHSTATRSP